jgi:sporulation protein YhbH
VRQNQRRFREIVKGKIKDNFKKYITHEEMIGKRDQEFVKIPIPRINIPTFKYGPKQQGGVGQGQGKPGDPVQGEAQNGQSGQGQAGDNEGQHLLEVEVTYEELAEILGNELHLPRIQPKGHKNIESQKTKYTGLRQIGPESLRNFKASFKEALKRQIIAGTYDAEDPRIIPIKKDLRYRSFKTVPQPTANAVVFYIMDVSGSMGEEQKEIVRLESFWLHTWIRKHYRGLQTRFIIHDASAQEVDEDTFFKTSESGGTLISSAYNLVKKLIDEEYPLDQWNIYIFHFSDGDNWSSEDTRYCIKLLREDILQKVNLFGYGQVESRYGSGQFMKDLEKSMGDEQNFTMSRIANRDQIIESIKTFLAKGN